MDFFVGRILIGNCFSVNFVDDIYIFLYNMVIEGIIMLEIKKYKFDRYYAFDILTDEGCFSIFFGGNLDLYFLYKHNTNFLETDDSKDFYITKDNYFLYSLFEELYNDVLDYNIFTVDNFDSKDEWLNRKKEFLEHDSYNPRRLFHDGKIDWHCDDFDYDEGASFVIERLNNCYKLTFNKCKADRILASYSVRIRNSGSRYGYFNIIFMRMYNKLCNYNPNYHQIHIEEYLYHKRLVRNKETI